MSFIYLVVTFLLVSLIKTNQFWYFTIFILRFTGYTKLGSSSHCSGISIKPLKVLLIKKVHYRIKQATLQFTGQNVVPITNAATAALKQHHQHYQQSSSNVGFNSQTAGNIKLVKAQSSIQHHPPVTKHLSIASVTKNNIASSLPHSSQQSQHQPTGSFKVAVSNINNATTSTNVVSSQQQVHLGLSYQHPQHAHMLSATSQLPSRVTNTSGQPNVQMKHLQPIHMTQRERMTHDRLGPIFPIHRVILPLFERAALPVAHRPTAQCPVIYRIEGPLPNFSLIPTPSRIAHQPAGLLPIVDQVSNSSTALNEQTSKL